MDSSVRSLLLVVLVSFSLLLIASPGPARAQSLQPHDPILITSVSDFNCANGVTCANNIPVGNGTIGNPFIIENWEITANTTAGIHVKGTDVFFTIRNVYIHPPNFTAASSGILLEGVTNGRVESLRVSNFYNGISISGKQNTLTNSEAWNNTYGVVMSGSGNVASSNQVHDNARQGIALTGSYASKFTGNNASSNGELVGDNVCYEGTSILPTICDAEGFGIVASSNNIFENNTAFGNFYYGFRTALNSNGNVYKHNNITKNRYGLIFTESTSNQAHGNVVAKNPYGVGLEGQDTNNNITGNWVTDSVQLGVYVFGSTQNMIYNNYLRNTVNAYDSSNQNAWNITKTLASNILGGPFTGGNFYGGTGSGYGGSDPDGDGIGNTPYVIHGANCQPQPCQPGVEARDLLPLVQTQPTGPVVDIEVRSIVAQPTSGRTGASISLTVTVFNEGTVTESFTVTATYNGTVINNSRTPINSLPALSAESFILFWDTNGLGPGAYLLRANATTVPGEPYSGNNVSPATTVTLSLNRPPTATFTISPTSTVVGSPITVDGTASTDPDGTVSYSWDFGDGTTATGPTASHSYSSAGTFTITLTVRDNEGAISTPASDTLIVSTNKPSMPTGLTITATNGKPKLTWSAPLSSGGSPIIMYRIYRGTSPDSLTKIGETTGSARSYVDTTAISGQTYYYTVTAVNSASESDRPPPQNVLVPGSGVANLPMAPQMWLAIAAIILVAVVVGVFVIRRRAMHPAS